MKKKVHIVAGIDDVKKSFAFTFLGYMLSLWMILKAFTGNMELETRIYLGIFGVILGCLFYFGNKWHKNHYGF